MTIVGHLSAFPASSPLSPMQPETSGIPMKTFQRTILASLGGALTLCAVNQALAQTATVTLSSQKQYIRGFGGMNHAAWAGDMTAADRTLAFGNGAGQLNLSILRIPVTDGNPGSGDVATAKAAIAAGAIVMATPWNAAHTYTSSDFASYATHLNNFVTYMKGQGVDLYSISVQNEPDYGSQAGWGSWSAASCHDFILNYGATITGTKLMACESFNYAKSYYDAVLNDSAALANVALFGTHLYGTAVSAYAYPNWNTKGAGKEMWMTEHYTDSTTDANSWPNALGVATEVHNTMVTGQMNAYVWWFIKRSYSFINGGAVTKRGGCIGHWSKFVRPGSYRVDATASPGSGLSLSAYKSDTSVVVNVVNTGSASTLAISIPGTTISSFTKYTTSSSKTLASDGAVTASNGSLSVSLDASSVTSLVGSGSPGGAGAPGTGGAVGIGGAVGTGGSKASGGSATGPTGGSVAVNSGGAVAFSTGGTMSASGGARSTGGSVAIGGSKATGGATVGGSSSATTGGVAAAVGGNASGTGGAKQTGGAPSTGTNPGLGGAPGTGGLVGSANSSGTSAVDNSLTSSEPGGCSCRVAGEGAGSKPFALIGVIGLFAGGLLRRRPKSSKI